ncbi:MAG: hypothetical protein ABIG46_02725 [Candidatus Omnitrophota bacterium]
MFNRRILFLFTTLFLMSAYAFADETITLATFYPSPYGVYNELRLFPRTTPPSTCNAGNYGAMYYNSTSQSLQVCTSTGWGSAGSGSLVYQCPAARSPSNQCTSYCTGQLTLNSTCIYWHDDGSGLWDCPTSTTLNCSSVGRLVP